MDAQTDLPLCCLHMSQVMRKPVLPHVNNKGADHTVHPRSLISTFVICSLESTNL